MPEQALRTPPPFRSRGWRAGNAFVSLFARLGFGPYFTATPDDPAEDFTAEADRHPVFELVTVSTRAARP